MIVLRKFNDADWIGLASATRFPNGDEPLICRRDAGEIVVDAEGITFISADDLMDEESNSKEYNMDIPFSTAEEASKFCSDAFNWFTRIDVRVTCEKGESWVTGINTTLEGATTYFMSNTFEGYSRVVKVELVP